MFFFCMENLLTSAFDERPYFFPPVFSGPKIDSHEMNIFASFLICGSGSRFPIFASARKRGQAGPQL